MKQLLSLGFLCSCLISGMNAQESPLWMRHCAISPDASTIAFTYKGDIYTVPTTGGEAHQLTTNASIETSPVWSPDSKRIAFASDRMGSMDVFIIDKKGGAPTRLTTHSTSELPIAFYDNDHVLYEAWIQPSAESIVFPSSQFKQVYKVSVAGGRPELFSSIPMQALSRKSDGKILYQDCKGYEDAWRKHQKSPIARDIWLYDETSGSHRKLTTFEGEDRNPVWSADGKSFFYLSEQDGSFNVYKRGVDDAQAQTLTHFKEHPVRFLSCASNGMLCFGYNGEIYTLQGQGEPKKLEVSIYADSNYKEKSVVHYSAQATEVAVSPNGKEVAFIAHGDVYVTSIDYTTTKRITNTPEQERTVSFSPDGRSLIYASEREGLWQIYTTSLARKDEKMFTYATELKEERLTHSDATSFYPQYSPNGKEVAFLENRSAIRVINLKSKEVRTVMDEAFQYSYSDGDQSFAWSPDSKWILTDYIGVGGWNNKDIALINVDGDAEIRNLTLSGYNDVSARWVLDGKAMIFFSDRAGYRSHGSWGTEDDVYIMFFDAEAYDRFKMSKEELEFLIADDKKKDSDDEDEKKDEKKDDKKDEIKPKKVKALKLDLDHCQDRVVRLTVNSSHLVDAMLSKKGDALYYLASFEGTPDLWKHDLKDGSTRIVCKNVGRGGFVTDSDLENIYMCAGGSLKKIEVSSSSVKSISMDAEFDYKPLAERQYIFDHAWRQVDDKFYVDDLQGTQWKAYRENYARFLPYINNNYDFAEMMSELLGELNASHTGMRYYSSKYVYPTAYLGIFIDETYKGDGLKIKEIVDRSPLAQKKTDVKAGCIIEKIDGEPIQAGQDYFPLLEGKVGRRVVLTIKSSHKTFEEVIKPISAGAFTELLYHRWVENNRRMVDAYSNGRLGYVHIKAMDGESFHTLYKETLGLNRQKEALVVDTRHNGGGWLHDDVVTLLSGKVYQRFMPRGRYIGSDPFNKWCKPSCMLICEDNYSNAHGTPWVYKTLGVGKLVGAPVAGTMTAVWWETQIDRSLIFGIPQVGCMNNDDQYLENQTLQPDILIYNTPEQVLKGEDMQIKGAVEDLLQGLDNAPKK